MKAASRLNVGHALAFRSDKLGFLLRCAGQAEVVELKLGRVRTFLLNDPADIRHVLVTEAPRFPKNPRLVAPAEPALFGRVSSAAPKPTTVPGGSRFSRLRPAEAPALADVVVDCADELLDDWASGDDFDVVREATALAQRFRLRVLLGDDADGIADELVGALAARQEYIEQVFVSPLPFSDRLPTRTRRRYRRAQESSRACSSGRSVTASESGLLTHLLELRTDDGTPVGDQRVFDEARGFLASYELSGRGLAWTLCPARSPSEVQSSSRANSTKTRADAALLGYPQMVYSEALRLYPPTWLFVRMTPTTSSCRVAGDSLPARGCSSARTPATAIRVSSLTPTVRPGAIPSRLRGTGASEVGLLPVRRR